MRSRDFCYWLQGFFEIYDHKNDALITKEQAAQIKKHLALVFKHEIDPEMGNAKHQEQLNKIHTQTSSFEVPAKEPLMRC